MLFPPLPPHLHHHVAMEYLGRLWPSDGSPSRCDLVCCQNTFYSWCAAMPCPGRTGPLVAGFYLYLTVIERCCFLVLIVIRQLGDQAWKSKKGHAETPLPTVRMPSHHPTLPGANLPSLASTGRAWWWQSRARPCACVACSQVGTSTFYGTFAIIRTWHSRPAQQQVWTGLTT